MTPPETNPAHAVKIRPATLADVAILTALGARTFRDTFAADNTPENVEAFLASHYRPPKQARIGRGQKALPMPDVCKALPLVAALAARCPGQAGAFPVPSGRAEGYE